MQVDTTPRTITSHTLLTNNKVLLHPGTISSIRKTTSLSHNTRTKLLHTQHMATSTNNNTRHTRNTRHTHNTRHTGMGSQHNSTLAIPNTMLQPIIRRQQYILLVTLGLGTQCIPRTPFNLT